MARCAGRKPDSSPCERIVGLSQGYCYAHDPDRGEDRKRHASRAARSKPNREIAALKARLVSVTDGVLAGRIDPRAGAVAVQGCNALARVLEVQRRWRELDEVEARITELEERTDAI